MDNSAAKRLYHAQTDLPLRASENASFRKVQEMTISVD